MDPIGMALSAIEISQKIYEMVQDKYGTPEWATLVNSGIYLCKSARGLIEDCKANPDRYTHMTPADLQELLLPSGWDALVEQAKKGA